MYNLCGWRTCIYYNTGGFLLEAKAIWGHTCIAGGFIVPRYKEISIKTRYFYGYHDKTYLDKGC
ncbi:MAG: hypothetical protein GXY89_02940 [Tissierellia bacterium]|nr:hypothetical protein [Tissierellia bacterium]